MKNQIQQVLRKFGYELHRANTTKVPDTLPMSTRWLDRLDYFRRMLDKVGDVDGDVVECGVGGGRSLMMLSYWIERDQANHDRRLFGFDSFEGFPEPTAEDASERNPKRGEWSQTSPEAVRAFIARADIPVATEPGRLTLVPGFLENTLPKWEPRPIVLLHVDVDLYEAYQTALSLLFPHVVEGGLVLFDEYHEPNWPGATKAIDEFFADTGYDIERDAPTGKWFVAKVSRAASS